MDANAWWHDFFRKDHCCLSRYFGRRIRAHIKSKSNAATFLSFIAVALAIDIALHIALALALDIALDLTLAHVVAMALVIVIDLALALLLL